MRAAILRSVFLSGVSLCLAATAASAQQVTERKYDAKAVESFYKGKQVDFFIGSEASGGYNAYARIVGHQVHLRASSYRDGAGKHAEGKRPVREAAKLGEELAARLK